MHFYNLMKDLTLNSKVTLFVDMDGVIASYDFNVPLDFKNKRPLTSNINVLKKVSTLNNIELHILSVCREDSQVNDKDEWLDKNAPFFDKDKRHILSKETYKGFESSNLKLDFLTKYKTNNKIVFIDDDIRVLKLIGENLNDIVLYQDSELVD